MKMTRAQRDQIVRHAEKEAPNECCGYLSARDGVVHQVTEAENTRRSPYGYELSADALQGMLELEDDGWEIGTYHSHPRSEARPSQTDINLVSPLTEHYTYFIVSLEHGGGDAADLRAWKIADGRVEEQDIVYDD